jgi:hypothetical protein
MAFALQYKTKMSGTNKPETPVSPSPNLSPIVYKGYRNDGHARTQKQQGKNPDNG